MKQDSDGVRLLSWISFGYRRINPDSGLLYASRTLDLARRIGWRRGEALAYNAFGNFHVKGEYAKALEAFYKALSIYEELGDKGGVATVCNNIGNVFRREGSLDKAMEYYGRSLKIATEIGDDQKMEHAIGGLAMVFERKNQFDTAIAYKKRALQIAERINDLEGIITQTQNLGATYGDLGRFPEALVYGYKALRTARRSGDKQSEAINLGNIGETYVDMAMDSVRYRPDSLVPAGKTPLLNKGIVFLKESIIACRACSHMEALAEYARYLSKAYIHKGDYRSALDAHMEFMHVRDSIYNIESSAKIADLETKRAVELKDKDIRIAELEVAKKRNERYGFVAGILLLLAIMGILLRSNKLLSKEKKRSDDLLLNILPSEVATELKERGAAEAKQFDEVSVLFTDFVNFTATSEKLSPQQLVRELHECFTAFDAIIERNGLEKIKTIGDAYMAVCGLPLPVDRHAQQCVLAAIEIRDFMKSRQQAGDHFQIRIGINSGAVVAGIVGVKKFAYDIWGDTVNLAARMEQHGEAGRINISQNTFELAKDEFECTYRGRVAAKNKGEIEMYFVEAKVAAPVL
jgi:class 3 adenylate cyclase